MKVLILAAGYGTRLEKDLEKTESHKDLIGIPKPLLPIAGSPLISHWMRIITNSPPLSPSDVHIVVSIYSQTSPMQKADVCHYELLFDGLTSYM
jgi:choline kinase